METLNKPLTPLDLEILKTKELRMKLDEFLQEVRKLPESREKALCVTKLQEGIMWLGMNLKRLGTPNPYPSSKDPSTGTIIEPTADGLKF